MHIQHNMHLNEVQNLKNEKLRKLHEIVNSQNTTIFFI